LRSNFKLNKDLTGNNKQRVCFTSSRRKKIKRRNWNIIW